MAKAKQSKAKSHPIFREVCICLGPPTYKTKQVLTECCSVCPGCQQRIILMHMSAHTESCVAYQQVTGKRPMDFSWFKALPGGRKAADLIDDLPNNPMYTHYRKEKENEHQGN